MSSTSPSTKDNVIRFIGWGHYDYEAARNAKKENRPHNQVDYYEALKDKENCAGIIDRIEELVIEEIVRKKFRFDGDSHQNYRYGCPIVEVDGMRIYYTVSWRHWGGIMAEAWTKIDGKGYDYMDFYMGTTQNDAGFRGPIIGIDINENGEAIESGLSETAYGAVEKLYAENQKNKHDVSEMAVLLYRFRDVLKHLTEEEAKSISYKVFKRDVDWCCHKKENPNEIDEEKANGLAWEKWEEMIADVVCKGGLLRIVL